MLTKSEIDAFLAIVQCGSISTAAEQLFITQPALSRRIKSIEGELGCDLFQRGRGARSVSLTSQGAAFLPIARKWLEVYEEALSVKDAVERPRLRISSVGSVRSFLMPGILRDATCDGAPYLVDFNLCHSAEAPGLIESGKTDVALVDLLRSPVHMAESVMASPVYSVPFALIGGSDWIGCGPVSAEGLDARREIRLPWNYSFDIWHERHFGESVGAMVRLDSAASIEHVLRDDLFCILPKTEALRIAALRSDVAMIDLVDGPPDETIHCLSSLSPDKVQKLEYFEGLLRKNLGGASGVKVLM